MPDYDVCVYCNKMRKVKMVNRDGAICHNETKILSNVTISFDKPVKLIEMSDASCTSRDYKVWNCTNQEIKKVCKVK